MWRLRSSRSARIGRWCGALGLAAAIACTNDPTGPDATVFFVIDAPLCGSVIPVEFSIDGALAGTDTFRVHLAPDHITTRGFPVQAGSHVLGARVPNGYVWPNRIVKLKAGQVFTESLPFYCS